MNKLPIAKNLQIERSRTTLLFNHWTPERTAAAVGVNRDEVQMQQRGETEWESVQAKNRQLVNELEKHRPSPGSARRTAVVHAGLIDAKAGGVERTGGQRCFHWCAVYNSWAPRAATNREEQRPMPLTNNTRASTRRTQNSIKAI
jgi:hypothetical protein